MKKHQSGQTRTAKVILISFALVACIPMFVNASVEITETRFLMGTFASITIRVDSTRQEYDRVLDRAFLEIKRLENVFSTYLPKSHISILNREHILVGEYTELREVISRSLYFATLSDGLFDITIKPVLDLYRRSFGTRNRAPESSELRRALSLVGHRNVVLDEDLIELEGHGIQITTDAIAKGYIIDKTVDFLLANGIRRSLVNIGGDIRAVGNNWKVALQNPRDANDYVVTIPLKNKALCTSGDYERYFTPDKNVHHILNPKTGQSATALISATIIAGNATDADALATTVFVMGPNEGMELIERLEYVDVLMITSKRGIIASSGFKWATKHESVEIARNPFIQGDPIGYDRNIKSE